MCSDLFASISTTVTDCLIKAGVRAEDVNTVILAGGATSIPKVEDTVRNLFAKSCKVIANATSELVAQGAAVQALLLANKNAEALSKKATFPTTSLSIGYETELGLIVPVFPKGTVVPATVTKTFVFDTDAKELEIRMFQGERALAKDNQLLLTVGLPVVGKEQEVTFNLQLDGQLIVQSSKGVRGATDGTGTKKSAEEAAKEAASAAASASSEYFTRLGTEQKIQLESLARQWAKWASSSSYAAVGAQLTAATSLAGKGFSSAKDVENLKNAVVSITAAMNAAADAQAKKASAKPVEPEEESEEEESEEEEEVVGGLDLD
jgi:molecular chaperone DnaK